MIQSIIEFLKQLFGFAEKLAHNKAAKIPLKEPAIVAKAKTKVKRHDIKQDKLDAEREWRRLEERFDFLVEGNLTKRQARAQRKQLEKLVKSGAIITDIIQTGDGLVIPYMYKGKDHKHTITF